MMTRRGHNGLTLIELMVGLSLAAMLLGFGAINLRSSKGTASTRAVAEILAEALRQAREEAIKERAPTAIVFPSQGGTKPHSQSFYRLRGAQFPRIQSVRQLDEEFPGIMTFVGHWPLAVSTNLATPPPMAGSRRLDFSAWQPPYPEDHHFIFTPEGEVVTNNKVVFDGAYHIVVCQGGEFTPEDVPPSPSFRATRLGRAYTVSVSLMGDVSVSNGLVGATVGIGVPDAPWPGDLPAQPPTLGVTANADPTIDGLDVSPAPYPPTLPAGADATVDLKGYLTIRTRAQDLNGGPLQCFWVVEEANGGSDAGALSSALETPMEWNGTEWSSVWEWRPPETAVAGQRFALTCHVKDPTGAVVQQVFGAAGMVEVTAVGEILFDTSRDGNREVYAMNADGSNLVNLTNHPDWDHMACWSPDGGRIAFVSNRSGPNAVFVMYADGTGAKQVSGTSTFGVGLPEWSPDGTQIVYSTQLGDPNPASYIVNADGSGTPTKVTTFVTPESFMRNAWHPSGNFLCVNTRDGAAGPPAVPGFDLFLMETDGSNRRNLTNTPGFDAMPRWSPDGNSLVWNSDRSGNHEVYVATFDGTDLGPPINVSNDSANADLQACWSPDSQKILFVKKDSDPMSGIGDIYSVERDGTPPPTRLTTHSSLDDFPSWRP